MRTRLLATAALLCAACLPPSVPTARAQSNPGYFIPPQPAAPRAPAPGRAPRTARPVPVAAAPLPEPEPAPEPDQAQQPMPPLPQPPVPTLPALPKGVAPPTAVVGVLGVPDVMRQSNAAQIIQRIVGARKEKLRVDVDRAQASWRELERQLQADAPKLTPEQGRSRENALRARVNADRKQLQDRNRIISEAGQVALNQIESTLVAVIRQVAESRGMNVVLHRSQVALNMPEFDITDQVVAQLNKLMPTVQIPAENVDPATLPKDWGSPAAAATPAAAH
jgi:Skp family chaperone for outer membrane proteins